MTAAAEKPLLIYLKSLSGGAGKAATQYATALAALKRYKVTLAAGQVDPGLAARLPPEVSLVDLGMRAKVPPLGALVGLVRRLQPDIVLVVGMTNGATMSLALTLARVRPRFIHREANAPRALLASMSPLRRMVGRVSAKIAYARADVIVCLTQGMRQEILDGWHVAPERMRLIPNGVAIPPMVQDARRLSDPPVILTVARLTAQKDIPTLLRAFALLRARRAVRLQIAGDGVERAALEALAAELGVAQDVTFLGHVDDPAPLFRGAHVYVLSSVFEGFPNTLIESLAEGCPVVATDCPTGPAEVIDSDDVGYLARMRDPADLAAKLDRALDREFDPVALRQRTEYFSEDRMHRAISDLMASLDR